MRFLNLYVYLLGEYRKLELLTRHFEREAELKVYL